MKINNKLLREWLGATTVSFLFILFYTFAPIISGIYGSNFPTVAELIKRELNLNSLFGLIGFFISQTIFFFVISRVFTYFTTTPFIYKNSDKKSQIISGVDFKKTFKESPLLMTATTGIIILVIVSLAIDSIK